MAWRRSIAENVENQLKSVAWHQRQLALSRKLETLKSGEKLIVAYGVVNVESGGKKMASWRHESAAASAAAYVANRNNINRKS
jgi:hypothetical protein